MRRTHPAEAPVLPPTRIRLAESRREVTRGLLARPPPAADEGMWLAGVGAIHTAFMRYALDVVFLDAAGKVLRIAPGLRPWRMARARGAAATLELPAGGAARLGLNPGDVLELVDSPRSLPRRAGKD